MQIAHLLKSGCECTINKETHRYKNATNESYFTARTLEPPQARTSKHVISVTAYLDSLWTAALHGLTVSVAPVLHMPPRKYAFSKRTPRPIESRIFAGAPWIPLIISGK